LFNVDRFKALLDTSWLAQDVIYLDKTDSTNSYLKQLSVERLCQGTLCIADNQQRGRGQYERNWHSEPFKNLTFTLIFMPSASRRLHIISLACALACCKQIEQEVQQDIFIKWPNDIMCKGKKLGGLLTESIYSGNRLDKLLVGVGLNVNQSRFPQSLPDATSIKLQYHGEELEREYLLAELLKKIEYNYTLWSRHSNKLLKSINHHLIGYGKWMKIEECGVALDGLFKILGINKEGHLLALSKSDEIKSYTYEQIRILPP